MKQSLFIFLPLLFLLPGHEEDFFAGMMNTPVIDGRIDAGEWNGARRYDTFTLFGRAVSGKAPLQTTAWIGCDSEHLYIAFRCMIRKGIPLRLEQKENDSQISHDDCVEIFLNGSPKGRTYLQLGQSAAGVRFDAEVRGGASQVNRNWSSSLWKNAAGRTSDFYDAEFAIPLKMLPLDGSGFLRFNLTRTVRAGGNAYLSLVPMSGDGWHQPEKFAKLILPSIAGYGEITAIPQERVPILMGNNNFIVILTNHTGREQTAELRLKTSDGETKQEWRLPPHAKQQVTLPWKCGNAAGTFSWSLCRNGKEIHVSAPESYVIDNGNWSIPAVSYAGRKIVCRLKVNYGNDELKKARIRLHLRKDGIDFTAPQMQPFTEKLPLAGLPPGGYEAEILVISEDGKTLFQGKSDFRVVSHFLQAGITE